MHENMHACIHEPIHTHTYIHINTHTCIHAYIHIYRLDPKTLYIQDIHTNTQDKHTYIHTYMTVQ